MITILYLECSQEYLHNQSYLINMPFYYLKIKIYSGIAYIMLLIKCIYENKKKMNLQTFTSIHTVVFYSLSAFFMIHSM